MNSSATSFQSNIIHTSQEKCLFVHELAEDLQCSFVEATPDCTEGEALFSYIIPLYCSFGSSQQAFGIAVYFFWLMILFITLGTAADNLFCPALTVIAKVLGLSENLAGVTILAFGNGSPDIFTALAGAPSGRTELVYGELFGSGMFVTTVIAGTICICCPFKVMERPFLRDTIFYMGAAFWAFYIFFKGRISLWESIGFILLYLVYIVVVVGGKTCRRWTSTGITESNEESDLQNNGRLQILLDEENRRASNDSVMNVHHPKSTVCVDLAVHAEQISQLASMYRSQELDKLRNEANKLKSPSVTSTTPLLVNKREDRRLLSLMKDFIKAINPIDRETWEDSNWCSRTFIIIKLPILFFLKLLIPVVNNYSERDGWCKLLNIFHCISTPIFCLFATNCAHVNILPNIEGVKVSLWILVGILCFGVSIFVACTSHQDHPPHYHNAYAFLGFIGSIILIYTLANEIISLLRAVGIVFLINEALLGLTVLAWGNSIGDFITDLSIAKQGYERMGFSACFGGPLFNTLLGIGISFTIAIVENDGNPVKLEYGGPAPLLTAFIFISLATSLVAFPVMKFRANRFYGFFLISLYISFVIVIITYELGFFVLPEINGN